MAQTKDTSVAMVAHSTGPAQAKSASCMGDVRRLDEVVCAMQTTQTAEQCVEALLSPKAPTEAEQVDDSSNTGRVDLSTSSASVYADLLLELLGNLPLSVDICARMLHSNAANANSARVPRLPEPLGPSVLVDRVSKSVKELSMGYLNTAGLDKQSTTCFAGAVSVVLVAIDWLLPATGVDSGSSHVKQGVEQDALRLLVCMAMLPAGNVPRHLLTGEDMPASGCHPEHLLPGAEVDRQEPFGIFACEAELAAAESLLCSAGLLTRVVTGARTRSSGDGAGSCSSSSCSSRAITKHVAVMHELVRILSGPAGFALHGAVLCHLRVARAALQCCAVPPACSKGGSAVLTKWRPVPCRWHGAYESTGSASMAEVMRRACFVHYAKCCCSVCVWSAPCLPRQTAATTRFCFAQSSGAA